MKIIKRATKFKLLAKSVDAVSDEVQLFLEQIGTERKNILRLKLTVENILLSWMHHFGEEKEFEFSTGSRFGRPYITLSLEGDEFDPIEGDEDFGEVSSHLFAGLGLYPAFNYTKNTNVISFKLKKRQSSPLAGLLTALVAAIVVGFAGMMIPGDFTSTLNSSVLNPIFDAFIGLLTTIATPMIFLSVAWGVYGIGDASMLGKIGKKMLGRYVLATFAIVSLSTAILMPLSNLTFAAREMDSSGLDKLIELILSIFPQNIVKPFLEDNTIQIILIAIVVGCIMLVLENQTRIVASFIEQINYIIQYLIEIVSNAVPFFIFIVVLRLIWSDSLSEVKNAWKAVVMYLTVAILITMIVLVYVSVKEKVSPILLVKKVLPSFLVALTTASSSAAFGTTVSCCEYGLGVRSKVTNFGVPLSIVLYKPATAVALVSYALYFTKEYNIGVSPFWIVSMVVVITILAIALTPIPGGATACYTILFLQLGIPMHALGIVLVLDIVADFTSTGMNTMLREMELVLLADRVNMLNKAKLRRKENTVRR